MLSGLHASQTPTSENELKHSDHLAGFRNKSPGKKLGDGDRKKGEEEKGPAGMGNLLQGEIDARAYINISQTHLAKDVSADIAVTQ